jgi:hypothetical protein
MSIVQRMQDTTLCYQDPAIVGLILPPGMSGFIHSTLSPLKPHVTPLSESHLHCCENRQTDKPHWILLMPVQIVLGW